MPLAGFGPLAGHHVYDRLRDNLMERFVQYVKDRTEGFDDYFPCRTERCRFEHVEGWLSYYTLSFTLFKRRDAFEGSPILQLRQIIRGPKDPPQLNRAPGCSVTCISHYSDSKETAKPMVRPVAPDWDDPAETPLREGVKARLYSVLKSGHEAPYQIYAFA
jgi:hypothetical protein